MHGCLSQCVGGRELLLFPQDSVSPDFTAGYISVQNILLLSSSWLSASPPPIVLNSWGPGQCPCGGGTFHHHRLMQNLVSVSILVSVSTALNQMRL